ncbi:MAG: hypothetical protein GTN40_03560 [Candidatus Aenigmarchaeota archaeon]|nr:hypothetical protein [Candidatus Aenigmarchaeota archaeon]
MTKTKITFLILFGVGLIGISLFLGFRLYSIKDSGEKKVSGSTASTAGTNDFSKVIEENIKKYHPKEDFWKKNYSNFDVFSDAAIVVDFDSGQILYEKNGDNKFPPASTMKIVTATVVLENLKKDQLITISDRAVGMEPNKIGFKPNEKFEVEDLLYGTMMLSANDAAEALAEEIEGGRNEFLKKMNILAKKLGLKNSHFSNPSGLDDQNMYLSTFDLVAFTKYALLNHPEILTYMGTKDYEIKKTDHNEGYSLYHLSFMLGEYPGLDGVKTGYTYDAGHTFLGTAKRGKHRLIVAFFNSRDANEDCRSLFDFGFSRIPELEKFLNSINSNN